MATRKTTEDKIEAAATKLSKAEAEIPAKGIEVATLLRGAQTGRIVIVMLRSES
jgi:hypothetical protein